MTEVTVSAGDDGGLKIECDPGPATPDRIVRVFLAWHCRRGGGDMNASASIFPLGALHVLRPVVTRDHAITSLKPLRFEQLCLASRARRGRRPQRPGNQSRCRAFLEVFPSAIRSRESPQLLARRNHLVEPGTITFRWNPLSSSLLRAATKNEGCFVKKLWSMRVP